MKKAVGYIRVSTEEQASSGVSLEAQSEKLRDYAKLYDIELVHIYVDAGFSAKTLKREGLQGALEHLGRDKADSLLIAKLDRLTRSVSDLNTLIIKFFEKFNLISVADHLDTNTAGGRLVLNVLTSVSQWEREVIGERTSAALQYKKAKGEYTGGHAPFGKKAVDGLLVDDEYEQEIISIVKNLRLHGNSYRKIAQELEENQIWGRTGRAMNHMQIARILRKE